LAAHSRQKKRPTPPGDPRRPHDSRIVFWQPFLLAIAALVAHARSLNLPFVFDDYGSIVDNPNIRQLWPLTAALTGPWQSALAGRPIVSLSLAVNYALGDLSPWGYHAWNLAVHLLAGLALFGCIRRTLAASPSLRARCGGTADWLAFACALLWLAHPLQTEVIDYVTERTESMMALFYLVTLYTAIRGMGAPARAARRWLSLSIVACALGMASKESMATAPVMVFLYDVAFGAGTPRRALRERRWFYAGLTMTWGILVALVAAGPRSNSAGLSAGVTPWTYLLNQPAMIVTYLKLTFWPHRLVLDYGLPQSVSLGEALPAAAVVIALMLFTAAAWYRHRRLAFLGTWFFLTLAPSSSVIPIATEVGAERRMYLPLAAVIVLVVVGGTVALEALPAFSSAFDRMSRWRGRLVAAGVTIVYCVLAALSLQRTGEYSSRTGIWQTVLDRRPHGRAHYSLAMELKDEGRRDEALRHYRLALTDTPEAHYALAFELDAEGKRAEAIPHFRDYVRLLPNGPNVVRAYTLMGRALASQGQLAQAEAAFRQVLSMQPSNVDARGGLADSLLRQERFQEAVTNYAEYVRAQPGNALAHHNLGVALSALDRIDEAVGEFSRAVQLSPNDPGMRQMLANAFVVAGRLNEAVVQFKEATRLSPEDAALHDMLRAALAAQGRNEQVRRTR